MPGTPDPATTDRAPAAGREAAGRGGGRPAPTGGPGSGWRGRRAGSEGGGRAESERGRPEPRPGGAPVILAAAVTTGWAVLVSATPVLLAVAGVLLVSTNPTDTEAVLRTGFAA